VYPDTHPQYSYQYGVQDAITGDVKNQHEERDGDVVKGYYTLVQPDGVTRTVHYSADAQNGFNAEVEYKGEPIVQKAVVAKAIIPTKTIVAAPREYFTKQYRIVSQAYNMFAKILAVSALIACAQAGVFELGHGHHATSYSSLSDAPVTHYASAPVAAHYAAPVAAYHHAPAVVKTVTHPQYSYQYGVQDAHTGDVKNQHEERDGDIVKGYYTLVQPDGVTRTVHYSADSHNGFNAEVEYKGEPIVQKAVVAKTIVAAAPVYKAYHH
ncbi:PREDICTED: cuticle protein-like, partial [Nicrophorus vespilloides]|uniref:Cuticle protein-like n=1 Tax=Nicrophorus vespilloides TaxID=110193 RepID=A0ABM1MA38_NICVS